MTALFIAVFVCLVLSAFFSAGETAFSAANIMRLENARDAGSRRAAVACAVCAHLERNLSALSLWDIFANTTAAALSAYLGFRIYGTVGAVLGTILSGILILFLGESIPRAVARKNANRLAMGSAYLVRVFSLLFSPLAFALSALASALSRPFRGERPVDEQDAAVEELQSILETVEDEGVIDEERSELLQAALDFSDISASEVMTARVDVVAIDIEDSWADILQTIGSAPVTRLPVYEDSMDNIIGILSLNRFFRALIDNPKPDLRSLLIAPCYVYKTVKLPAVLAELRRAQVHMAIVTDEYGGTMGVVTMEDVLEQIVGDIWDETDEIERDVVERADGVYEVDGDMSISDFLELLDRDEDSFETESSTVGGWTMEMYGGFPREGESIQAGNLTITVLAMDGLRVDKVLVTVNPPEEAES